MISAVLPVYNEKGNLKPLCKEIRNVMAETGQEYEIVFVDDGSRDGSREVLEKLVGEYPEIRAVEFRDNFGQSAALQAGFDYAEGDTVVAMDSDMQNDPADIPALLQKLEQGYDCVSGWRKDRDDPLGKRIASRFADILQRPFLDKEIHDYGCTLKAYRSECLDELQLRGEMHRYIPALLRWKGYSVTEIKVNHRERNAGKTKYGTARLVKGFLDMLNVWFWQKFSQRPIHVFGSMAVILGLFGFLTGSYMLYLWIFQGADLSGNFLSVVSFFSIVMAAQFFTSGIIADIALKNYHGGNDRVYNVEKVF